MLQPPLYPVRMPAGGAETGRVITVERKLEKDAGRERIAVRWLWLVGPSSNFLMMDNTEKNQKAKRHQHLTRSPSIRHAVPTDP